MSGGDYWPFVLPLPSRLGERVGFLSALFSSPVVTEILTMFGSRAEVCQSEAISALSHHSNKTVIGVLKRLVKVGVLEERSKIVRRGSRATKVKCYALTEIGRWYSLFLRDPDSLRWEELRRLVTELASLFLARILALWRGLGGNHRGLLQDVVGGLVRALAIDGERGERAAPVAVVVLGSMALDVYVGGPPKLFHGGSGANVAVCCASLGLPTAFVTRIPATVEALLLVTELRDRGVSLRGSLVDPEASLPICLVAEWSTEEPRIICNYDRGRPPVLTGVSDDLVALCREAKAIYLGEGVCRMYVELLNRLGGRGDRVLVFRPTLEGVEGYLEECLNLMPHGPIVLLNEGKLRRLEARGLNPPDLLRAGALAVVVTRGSSGATIYTGAGATHVAPPAPASVVDTVGAGDVFSAALMAALLRGADLLSAVKEAITAAARGVEVMGPRKCEALHRPQ